MRFKERLAALGFDTYQDYLESAHWQTFRARYKFLCDFIECNICSAEPVLLHHISYQRLGHERFEDVMPLCQECHQLIHAILKDNNRPVEHSQWAVQALKKQLKKKNLASKSIPLERATETREQILRWYDELKKWFPNREIDLSAPNNHLREILQKWQDEKDRGFRPKRRNKKKKNRPYRYNHRRQNKYIPPPVHNAKAENNLRKFREEQLETPLALLVAGFRKPKP